MSTFTLAAALFLLFTAAGVIWLNPRRFSNQAFSLVSTILAAWLGCVYQAMKAGAIIAQGGDANLVYWLRNINLVAAFLPGSIWLQMVATIESNALTRKIIIRAIPWTLLATFLCFLTFHNTFAEKGSDGRLTRGSAYILYTTLGICAFGACLYQAFTKYSELKGIRRVELQFLSFSVAFAGLLLGLFNTLGSIFDIRFLNRSSIVVIFGSYIIIAGALIFHRVFNARQVFAFLAQKVALAITLCLGILYLPTTISPPLPTTLAQLVSILFCSAGVLWLNGPSKRWLGIDNDEMIAKLRRSLINLSLEESNTDKRRDAWERLLVEHFSASEIIVHSHDKSAPGRRSLSLSRSSAAYHCLAKASWATPESLQRQRSSPASQELRDFLVAQSLGVAVAVPRGSPNPSLIVALGIKTNDAPFTYPEVLRLQNIAELLDSMLTRSQLSTQAALQAKMEHLAMMSRGLAHDLKNLITPISSYLLHTKARHQFGTLESGVHESAQRSVNVMNLQRQLSLRADDNCTSLFLTGDL